jgi:hypothetical protein
LRSIPFDREVLKAIRLRPASGSVFSNPRMSLKGLSEAGSTNGSFSGFFHICFVVAVVVGMWESALSISKVCGRGGKQHYRFPVFP